MAQYNTTAGQSLSFVSLVFGKSLEISYVAMLVSTEETHSEVKYCASKDYKCSRHPSTVPAGFTRAVEEPLGRRETGAGVRNLNLTLIENLLYRRS